MSMVGRRVKVRSRTGFPAGCRGGWSSGGRRRRALSGRALRLLQQVVGADPRWRGGGLVHASQGAAPAARGAGGWAGRW